MNLHEALQGLDRGRRPDLGARQQHAVDDSGAGRDDPAMARQAADRQPPLAVGAFPEDELLTYADNTWGDTGRAIVNNWLGLVYQVTNLDRRSQFMPGIDRDDPLGIRAGGQRVGIPAVPPIHV